MRINLLLLLATILLGAGLTFWMDGSLQPNNIEPSPVVAVEESAIDRVPSFAFKDMSGKSHDMEDFEGQVVLINFWATWCAPCVIEFPKLIKLAQQNPDITIIGLSSDIDDAKIEKFIKKMEKIPSNFIIARDVKRKITTDLFATYKLPETVIVAPDGRIVKKILGDTDWNGQEIQKLLSSLKE